MVLIALNAILLFGILIVACIKRWWNLEQRIKKELNTYPTKHKACMNISESNYYKARKGLFDLLERFSNVENRFNEMSKFFGSQCEELQPKFKGFNRCIYHLALEIMVPVLLVLILVYC